MSAQQKAFNTISRLTNDRQAAKVMDLGGNAVLYCGMKPGSDIYFGWCEHSLHGVWYVNGSYCDDRHLEAPQVAGVVERADVLDVDHDPPEKILGVFRRCREGDD